jgi:hypothetical protein
MNEIFGSIVLSDIDIISYYFNDRLIGALGGSVRLRMEYY